MKIRLEKPAVNVSKLTGDKNEKPRQGHYMKNVGQIYILFTGKVEIKINEYVICRQEDL